MNKDRIDWGDLLADEVIKKHKKSIISQPQPNYFLWPIKYCSSDTWATKEWWINTGIKLVDEEIDVLTGLEILLNANRKDYLKRAYVFIEELWNEESQSLYEEDSYYNIIVHFPEGNRIRDSIINYGNMHHLDANDLLRKALIRINDEKICHYVSMKIIEKIENSLVSEYELENYIMPRLTEFKGLWVNYFQPKHLEFIKLKCLDLLEKDKWVYENKMEKELKEAGERNLWIKDVIAYWSWSLNWIEILNSLKTSNWYWNQLNDLFHYDDDNMNFLVWSNYSDDVLLHDKSIEMMENYIIDGAIAWSRMRQVVFA